MKLEPRFGGAQRRDTIIVDREYIRAQAKEALKSFVAPLFGVYEAAFGPLPTARTETLSGPRPKRED